MPDNSYTKQVTSKLTRSLTDMTMAIVCEKYR